MISYTKAVIALAFLPGAAARLSLPGIKGARTVDDFSVLQDIRGLAGKEESNGFAQNTCAVPEWVPNDNTDSPTGMVRCCAGQHGKDGKDYGKCDTSSCPNNFNAENRNCFNFGAPQNGGSANANAGSEKCPYADSDHAICDTSYYDSLNGVSCRENPNGKNYQNHCLGKVKCNTKGVYVPKNGHSDGTSDYDDSGNTECSGASNGFKAGDDCFYDGHSENWKVCDGGTAAPTASPKDDASPTAASPVASPTDCDPALPAGLSYGSYDGNPQCTTDFGFDFGYKVTGCVPGTFNLGSGGEIKGSCAVAGDIFVTITCNSAEKSATISWTGLGDSAMAIKVKGGPQGTMYTPTNGGTYIAGYNGGGNVADISHIEFCINCVGESCVGIPDPSPTDAPTAATTTPTVAPTVAEGHPSAAPTTSEPTIAPSTTSPTFSRECPADQPDMGSACGFEGNCEYGSETCCDGTTHPSFVAQCSEGGTVVGYHTDACMSIKCTDAPSAGTGETSAPSAGTGETPAPTGVTVTAETPAPTGGTETGAPTPAPKDTPPGSFGDPHIKVWSGETYDFHGSCDLILLDNPSFHDGVGMTIHIRTKIVTWWSYIETAVLRIGSETIEVAGGPGGKQHSYYINGVEGDSVTDKGFLFAGLFNAKVKRATNHQVKIRVDLRNGDAVGIETFKDFVRVNIQENDPKWNKFAGAVGLMGAHPTGARIGRDGKTVFTDMNAFGKEWQVLQSEPKLFRTVEGPQHPTQCVMPERDATSLERRRRRLGESKISREQAEKACAGAGTDKQACVFDVLATNDLDMAESY